MTTFIVLHKSKSGTAFHLNPDAIVRMYNVLYSGRRPKEMRDKRVAIVECVNGWYEVREWVDDILELIKEAQR